MDLSESPYLHQYTETLFPDAKVILRLKISNVVFENVQSEMDWCMLQKYHDQKQ